jgi:hypothetical protein
MALKQIKIWLLTLAMPILHGRLMDQKMTHYALHRSMVLRWEIVKVKLDKNKDKELTLAQLYILVPAIVPSMEEVLLLIGILTVVTD